MGEGPGSRRRGSRRGRLLAVLVLGFAGGLVLEPALDLLWPLPDLEGGAGFSPVIRARGGETLRVLTNRDGERCFPLPVGEAGPWLPRALLAAEDRRFYEHSGVDFLALCRAAGQFLLAGRVVSGASTLTMQCVRLLEPRPRTLLSKFLEILRARQLERRLDKKRILRLYLERAPLGGLCRGFEAAARYWFGKPTGRLGPAEAATLVGMLPAPTRRRPTRRPDLCRKARNRVLLRMVEQGFLDEERGRRLRAAPLGARPHPWPFRAPFFCDRVVVSRSRLEGELRTSLDLPLQERCEEWLARNAPPVDGAALLVLERRSGAVRVWIGGPDWRRSKLDVLVRPRMVGSTLKPFLFALARRELLAGGSSPVVDLPGRFGNWEPSNFDDRHAGRLPADRALRLSRNLPAVRLCRALGLRRFVGLLEAEGLRLPRPGPGLDLVLGTASWSPRDLAEAWRRFADPKALPDLPWAHRKAVLRALLRRGGTLPSACLALKTGTSSWRRDSWCVGVTRAHVLVAWFGRLSGAPAPFLVGAGPAAAFCRAAAAMLPELRAGLPLFRDGGGPPAEERLSGLGDRGRDGGGPGGRGGRSTMTTGIPEAEQEAGEHEEEGKAESQYGAPGEGPGAVPLRFEDLTLDDLGGS